MLENRRLAVLPMEEVLSVPKTVSEMRGS
jgi:hypothetical protein